MYEGKTHSLFLRYAVPQMLGLLFNSVYLIVDGIFIGNRLGRDAMAAAAVAVPFIEVMIAVSLAVSAGAGAILSGCLGRGEREQAIKACNTAIRILALIGLFIMLLGNLFIHPIAEMLGATPDIHDEAVSYLRYIVTFAPFLLFSFLLGGLVRNDGRPKLAMFALTFGSVSNIVLDYVFMYPLNMGIGGAALATALGPIFSVLILLPHFIFAKGNLRITRCRIELRQVKRILYLGIPSFIMEFSIGIVTFIYNSAIVRHGGGELGLAAYLLIGYLMLIILTLFLGLAEGLQPVFSYFSGAGEQEGNRAMRTFATKVFLVVGIVCYGVVLLFAKEFYSIFTPNDLELITFAAQKSRIYFCGFFLAGFNILRISYWQSIQQTKQALTVSLLRSMIFPPIFILLLALLFGSEIIWVCHSLAEMMTACAVLVLSRAMRHSKA